MTTGADTPLLEVRDLSMAFSVKRGLFGSKGTMEVRAVREVSLTINAGETMGLVGESGSGKTTLGRCILGAHRPTAGKIIYHTTDGRAVDLAGLGTAALRPYRQEIRMIFQDPNSSLNPRMTIGQIVAEPLITNKLARGQEIRDRVASTLALVGLRTDHAERYPHAFSGGERQRIGIARALITNPRLVVCDEAVTALDVSIRSQVLNLLQDLQERLGLTYLFISHDLTVIKHLCDRIAVMYVGGLVEQADCRDLFVRPRHPYTETLLRSLPCRTHGSVGASRAPSGARSRIRPMTSRAASSTPVVRTHRIAAARTYRPASNCRRGPCRSATSPRTCTFTGCPSEVDEDDPVHRPSGWAANGTIAWWWPALVQLEYGPRNGPAVVGLPEPRPPNYAMTRIIGLW